MGTILGTVGIVLAATGGKKEAPAPSGSNMKEALQKVKESVPLGASSR